VIKTVLTPAFAAIFADRVRRDVLLLQVTDVALLLSWRLRLPDSLALVERDQIVGQNHLRDQHMLALRELRQGIAGACIGALGLNDGSYIEVFRPSAQRAVQLAHRLCYGASRRRLTGRAAPPTTQFAFPAADLETFLETSSAARRHAS